MKPLIQELDRAIERGWANGGHLAAIRELALEAANEPEGHAPQAPPAAAPAVDVTPMRQPRADLARLVESINVAVYANGYGLSVTEAIGALELAKHEILQEQGQ